MPEPKKSVGTLAVDTIQTAEVLNHMFAHGKVRVLLDDRIIEGTLRHLCGPDPSEPYPQDATDVRDCHVRITTKQGFEIAVLLGDLADKHGRGECALDRDEVKPAAQTGRRGDCRYCERYSYACGRDHSQPYEKA